MPGIFGVIETAHPNGPRAIAPEIAECLKRGEHESCEFEAPPEAGWALGRSTLGFVNTAPQPVHLAGASLVAVMDGELYEADALRKSLESRGRQFRTTSHAEILLHGYQEHGRDFFTDLSGAFAAAIWDASEQRLVLVNDRFGLLPVYYAHREGEFIFASSLRALLAEPRVGREVDWQGLSQFFSFGHYLNDHSSVAGVRVLPTGAWFEYDAALDRLTADRLRRQPLRSLPTSEGEWLDQITDRFSLAVQRRTRQTPGLGLALSGGLDARTILGAIESPRELQTVCLGMKGSLDHACASQMAAIAGCKHYAHVLDHQFLTQFEAHLENMVRLTDGQYLSQCIVMPTLPMYRDLGVQVLLRGHAGELMHMEKAYNYSLDDAALAIRSESDLEAWLSRRLQAYILGGVEGRLFLGERQEEIASLARQSLMQSLAESADEATPVQRLWRHFVSQRLARETVLSLMKFRSVVEVRLPYLDNDLIDLLLAAPVELKRSETIQAHMLRRLKPEFLKVKNANTGASVGAAPWKRKAASLKLRVLAKLGAPGYQPYERLGLWLRQEIAPVVRKILLDDRCLERGVFDPNTVRQVVDQHLDNKRNHTFLLMALLVFETGQRRLNDAASDRPLDRPAMTGV